jgi:phosphate butyryltransferase
MSFESLDFLLERARGGRRRRLAVACGQDPDVLEAVSEAQREGVIQAVLVGDRDRIREAASGLDIELGRLEIVHEEDDEKAVRKAVQMVSSGEADLLMKGRIKTATLLKAVLNRDWGLRSGSMLSHLFMLEAPLLKRVFGMTDGGLNLYPTLEEKEGILRNAVDCYHRLGVAEPRVAALAAVEVVNPAMPCTLDAAALTQMNRRGQIPGCFVDGPLALDNAVSEESARHKGIESPVAGKADILLVPHIEAGNLLGKALLNVVGAPGAGIILGASRPVVLTSRTDTARTKLLSIALGAVLSGE